MKKKKEHDCNIQFKRRTSRMIDGITHKLNTSNAILRVSFENPPRINLNIIYMQAGKSRGRLIHHVVKLKEDLIKVMLKNGYFTR